MTLLFSFPHYKHLARSLLKASSLIKGEFSLNRFLNQELHLSLQTPVHGQECFIVSSISPPETHIFSLLALSHTLKREGAKKCTVFLPYLAYARHERPEPRKSRLTALIGALFQAAGIDHVITCDVHSKLATQLFSIPVTSLSPSKIFIEELQRIDFHPDTLVCPDRGALQRCQTFSKMLSCKHSIVTLQKIRDAGRITHLKPIEPIGKKIVILDDILDTGKTLLSCVKELQAYKPEEIIIMVTHGIFTGDRWKQLLKLKVKKIYCTNTIPHSKQWLKAHHICQLSIAPILEEIVRHN